MSIKREIKSLVEKVTGVRLFRKLPRGIDVLDDIRNYLPGFEMKIIFDVGANTGQSAQSYLNKFPQASLYCFEPVQSTFEKLQESLPAGANVSTFQIALGANTGTGEMVLEGDPDMHFLRGTCREVTVDAATRLETVNIDTLDNFCATHNVGHIDYLKIDTEGADLDVLIGAQRMLAERRIDLVEVEAGMNPGNQRHVPFEKLKSFLESRNYYLFGIYEQVEEWRTNKPHLRRTNLVFISESAIDASRTKPAA
ncbi:MAG TPA: FkbM family methyltransferase [Candidatus Binataceae bacterium]|nr:FkbM family methyltransferase [Candidatus Binataceae bacterium]HYB89698.1 FkbM family methyltransferase [Candidatus Binataceae bacterium]